MSDRREVMQVSLPVPEAADLVTRAAAVRMPIAEYLGYHVLASAYGVLHPEVRAFFSRTVPGIYGPETAPESAAGEPGTSKQEKKQP